MQWKKFFTDNRSKAQIRPQKKKKKQSKRWTHSEKNMRKIQRQSNGFLEQNTERMEDAFHTTSDCPFLQFFWSCLTFFPFFIRLCFFSISSHKTIEMRGNYTKYRYTIWMAMLLLATVSSLLFSLTHSHSFTCAQHTTCSEGAFFHCSLFFTSTMPITLQIDN